MRASARHACRVEPSILDCFDEPVLDELADVIVSRLYRSPGYHA